MSLERELAEKFAGIVNKKLSLGRHDNIQCPVCGEACTHVLDIEDVDHIYAQDYESGRGVRGDVRIIPMECERGHTFELNLGFHKGLTILSTTFLGNQVDD